MARKDPWGPDRPVCTTVTTRWTAFGEETVTNPMSVTGGTVIGGKSVVSAAGAMDPVTKVLLPSSVTVEEVPGSASPIFG